MNTVAIHDTPISYGLSLEFLRGHRMEQVGKARARLRDLRNNPLSPALEIEAAENALEDAREAYAVAQRMSDEEARRALENEGISPCKR